MTDRGELTRSAIEHCRRSLALMDQAGDGLAAAKLQGALDTMLGRTVSSTEDDVEVMLNTPEGSDLQEKLGWTCAGPRRAR